MSVHTSFNKIFARKKILITGGSGFIGKHLIRRLLEYGGNVYSLAFSTRKRPGGEPNLTPVQADLRDKETVLSTLGSLNFDYVIHAAGYIDHSPFLSGGRSVIDVHLTGTLNLIEAVWNKHLKGFVYLGSSDEYGNAASPQHEGLREAPFSSYSSAKTASAHIIQALHKADAFPGSIVRLFLVYGPGQDHNRFIPQIIRGSLQDRIFPASEGMQLRDFCYIEDVVQGILTACATPEAQGEIINIASGKPATIRSVVEMITDKTGKGKPEFGKHPYRPGENMELYADINKARDILKWSPQTDLHSGLNKTIKWYKDTLSDA